MAIRADLILSRGRAVNYGVYARASQLRCPAGLHKRQRARIPPFDQCSAPIVLFPGGLDEM
jgi:hypothetical protein